MTVLTAAASHIPAPALQKLYPLLKAVRDWGDFRNYKKSWFAYLDQYGNTGPNFEENWQDLQSGDITAEEFDELEAEELGCEFDVEYYQDLYMDIEVELKDEGTWLLAKHRPHPVYEDQLFQLVDLFAKSAQAEMQIGATPHQAIEETMRWVPDLFGLDTYLAKKTFYDLLEQCWVYGDDLVAWHKMLVEKKQAALAENFR